MQRWLERSRHCSAGSDDRFLRTRSPLPNVSFAHFPHIPYEDDRNPDSFSLLYHPGRSFPTLIVPALEKEAESISFRSLSNFIPAELRWLTSALRPVCSLHAASFLAFSIGSALGLLGPLVLRWLIDSILPARDAWLLVSAVALLLLSYEGRIVFSGLGSWLTVAASQKIVLALRLEILRHLDSLSAYYQEATPTGEKLYPLREPVEEIAYFGSDLFPGILRTLLSTALTLLAMSALSPRLTLIVLPVVPVFLLTRHHFRRRLGRHADNLQDKRLQMSSFLEEHAPSVVQIQSLQNETRRERQAYRLFGEAARAQLRLARTGVFFSIFTNLAIALAISATIGYGGVKVLSGDLTIGSLVAFYSYLSQLFDPLSGAMEMYARAQKTFSSIRRVRAALAVQPSIGESVHAVRLPPNPSSDIEFHDLRFAYPGQKELLHIPHLRIRAGECVALVGENGAGKSTLAKLAARLYDPDLGQVSYGGVDLRAIPLKELRSLAAYLPATPVLFDDTFEGNLRLGRPQATDQELAEVLSVVDLAGFVESFPLLYKQPLGPGGSRLSSGQQQRVALARALLKRPRILILDEATSSMDAAVEQVVLDRTRLFLSSSTILLLSHRLSSIRWADRVIVLEAGKIVRDGNSAA
jgi:ABC-type bacteriocin/lantibiotic exporter with double-glycine peptidase domain